MCPERKKLVQKWVTLTEEGRSIRDIAREFSVTPGAVSGALWRAKAPRRKSKYSVVSLAARRKRKMSGEKAVKAVPPHVALYDHPDFNPVSLTDLPDTGCKYPVTALPPHRHCAMPKVHGKPYCQAHMDLCTSGE